MTAVYALRHPQTTWNVEERYQGRLEAPVSREGQVQTRLVSRAFGAQGLDAVYSSPLNRSRYMAQELAQAADCALCIDQRLTELGLGAWEGLYRHQIEVRYSQLYDAWYARPDTVRFPGGESLEELQVRALAAFDDIFRRHPGQHVAVVTHSTLLQTVVASALSIDLRYVHRIRIANASTTTFCGSTAPGALLSLNDTEPLYHSPAGSAKAQSCADWKPRRATA